MKAANMHIFESDLSANRPKTTLFMLMSVDGKISTGDADGLDFDQDLPHLAGVKEGLQQYYDIEQTTDLWSLNSGRVQAKVGVNEREMPDKTDVNFVVIDNHHLTEHGVEYFCKRSRQFVLVTTNTKHPGFSVKASNMEILLQKELDLVAMLHMLKTNYGCESITIQTGGTLNGLFLRKKLIDYVDIVVAPLLVGGKNVPTLVDGDSISDVSQLSELGVLKLISAEPLENSYLRLKYEVIEVKGDDK